MLGAGEGGFHGQVIPRCRGPDEDGGIAVCGVIPAFYAELEARGAAADTTIFRS